MDAQSQEVLAAIVVDICKAITAPIVAENERLRASINELRSSVEVLQRSGWQGTWRSGEEFAKGAICWHDGEIWINATSTNCARPGTSGWKRVRLER